MEKQILIGSIIAVVILVLMSFTGVVGYQSAKSSTIAKVSPLFSVRTQRALDKESKDIACDYVGKGEEITIPLPTRESRNVFINKLLDIISKMDEKELNMFKESVMSQIIHFKSIEGFNVDNFEEIINKSKINQTEFINNFIGGKGDEPLWTKDITCWITCGWCELTVGTKFLCYVLSILALFAKPVLFIYVIITSTLGITFGIILLINQVINTLLNRCNNGYIYLSD